MDKVEIIWKFQNLRQSTEGGVRAPHKPLLVLYAIGRLLRNKRRLIPYCEVHKSLKQLLREFGFRETRPRPEYPFWRLRNDSFWRVTYAHKIVENSSGDVNKDDLLEHNVSGGFHKSVADRFQEDPRLVSEVIQIMLYKNFALSIHEDILQAVGIGSPLPIFQWHTPDSQQRKRNRSFRTNILNAYEEKCAVCGFDAKLGTECIGLEAAHIKWHMHDGPDVVDNGLALCSLHHKLFDRGAFTLSREWKIFVSGQVHGSVRLEEWLGNFGGKQISLPHRRSDYPAVEYIDWHTNTIFKGD